MRRLGLPALAVGYAALIFYVSSLSYVSLPAPGFVGVDKLLHSLEYAVLGLLVTWSASSYLATARRALFFGIVLCSLYGASDEFHQSLVPGRESDVLDWLADTFGGAVGAAAWLAGHRRGGSR